jgi:hypothetical protein
VNCFVNTEIVAVPLNGHFQDIFIGGGGVSCLFSAALQI